MVCNTACKPTCVCSHSKYTVYTLETCIYIGNLGESECVSLCVCVSTHMCIYSIHTGNQAECECARIYMHGNLTGVGVGYSLLSSEYLLLKQKILQCD